MRMLTRKTFILALSLAWLAGGATARAQRLQMPAHEKVVLKNGLTVLLLEKHSVPMVSVAGIVKAGGLYDPAGMEGLASTAAGLLRESTKGRTAQKVAGGDYFISRDFLAGAGGGYL